MLHWLKCQAQSPAGHQSPAEHPRALGPIQGMMGQHLSEPAGAMGREQPMDQMDLEGMEKWAHGKMVKFNQVPCSSGGLTQASTGHGV